ncbi:hypothetical protein IV79_GL001101 [Pediococcus claussenii]|nr:hypothetical protein IV79_GL001101 [Pediococcus claussenii]
MAVSGKKVNADTNDDFVQEVSLTNDNGVKTDKFDLYDRVQINWHFVFKNHEKENKLIELKIPSILQPVRTEILDLKTESGKAIGKIHVDANSQLIQIKLDTNVEKATEGTVKVWTQFIPSKIKISGIYKLDWGNSKHNNVNITGVDQRPNPNEMLSTWYWFDKKRPDIIHWRNRIDFSKKSAGNFTFKVNLGKVQRIVKPSLNLAEVEYTDKKSRKFKMIEPMVKRTITDKNNNVIINFESKKPEVFILDYETQMIADNKGSYKSVEQLAVNKTQVASNTRVVEKHVNSGVGKIWSLKDSRGHMKKWMLVTLISGLAVLFIGFGWLIFRS